jgi:hypothetical protein
MDVSSAPKSTLTIVVRTANGTIVANDTRVAG